MAKRHELTDRQWGRIKDRIPGKESDPGRTGQDNRRFLNAALFVLRTGIQWEDLPERYGNWQTRKKRYHRWAKDGVWGRLYKELLLDERDFDLAEELTELHLDSTSIKAHPNASTGRRGPGVAGRASRAGRTKTEADARRCLGRSRGGLTTKAHAGCLKSGRLWDSELTEGRRHDGKVGERLLKRYRRGRVGAVAADAGYDTNGMRRQVRRIRARRCIKPTRSRKGPRRYDRKLYRRRNKIERLFGRLKRFRRVATRYEKTAACYVGFIRLAALLVDVL